MHFLLMLLLALEGGAFSGSPFHSSFHAAPAVAGANQPMAPRPNDGGTGPPDTIGRMVPVPATPVTKSVPRVRHDGGTGPPDHP